MYSGGNCCWVPLILTYNQDKSPWNSKATFIFFCHSWFPQKTVHPFQNFLAALPPPPYTKLKLGKNSGYTRPILFVGACVNWKMPQECKSVPRLLSTIVD